VRDGSHSGDESTYGDRERTSLKTQPHQSTATLRHSGYIAAAAAAAWSLWQPLALQPTRAAQYRLPARTSNTKHHNANTIYNSSNSSSAERRIAFC